MACPVGTHDYMVGRMYENEITSNTAEISGSSVFPTCMVGRLCSPVTSGQRIDFLYVFVGGTDKKGNLRINLCDQIYGWSAATRQLARGRWMMRVSWAVPCPLPQGVVGGSKQLHPRCSTPSASGTVESVWQKSLSQPCLPPKMTMMMVELDTF